MCCSRFVAVKKRALQNYQQNVPHQNYAQYQPNYPSFRQQNYPNYQQYPSSMPKPTYSQSNYPSNQYMMQQQNMNQPQQYNMYNNMQTNIYHNQPGYLSNRGTQQSNMLQNLYSKPLLDLDGSQNALDKNKFNTICSSSCDNVDIKLIGINLKGKTIERILIFVPNLSEL